MFNINDVFWTFQGEGQNWGRRALFVRMPFCNLACSWCDTSFNTFRKWSEKELSEFAQSESTRFAVITGGEPTMNKHTPGVIRVLKDLEFELAIESNGAFPIPDGIDFVTISPKRDNDYDVHPDAFERAREFKYVVDEGFDFKILDRHMKSEYGPRLSLSPEFGNFEKSMQMIRSYIILNPHWRFSLQTHKWLNIP
jgi:7-carboxy-7-deazaguanine synthase